MTDPRADEARRWALSALSLDGASDAVSFEPASADASFRRYFRLRSMASGRTWVVMDAPPERENCAPFVDIAMRLARAGLHVPQVLAQDPGQGFLLLADLGARTYLQVLEAHGADAPIVEVLFEDALQALVRQQAQADCCGLPAYDAALLQRELALFPDWFVGRHLRHCWTAAQAAAWDRVCVRLVDSALAQPQVFVHRDFMPRNLMQSTPNPGVLDFQDAVRGPVTYDPACLFKDAFWSWPEPRIRRWLARYRELAAGAGVALPPDFDRALDWMGVQRHLKVLGIFSRIRHRDGKPRYLDDAPRFVRYVREVVARHADLAELGALFDDLELHA